MIPLYYWIILMFTIQTTPISTYWVSFRGLWYYISENGDTRNYTDAVNYCANLSGHLATIVNNHQRNFLVDHTGYAKRWVGLSTIHMHNHNENCNNIDMVWAGDYSCAVDYFRYRTRVNGASCSAYTLRYERYGRDYLTVSDCKMKYGFICQWQCNTLDVVAKDGSYVTGVYEQQHYRSNCNYYAKTNLYTDPVKSLHAEIVTDNNIFCSNFPSYDCPYKWTFSYGDTNKAYTISQNLTPYNSNQWQSHASNEYTDIYFTCMDCLEYEITFSNGSTKNTAIVTKRGNHDYTNDSDPNNSRLLFDHDSARWCFEQHNTKIVCFEYEITPIGYISTFISDSSTLQLSIHCKTIDSRDDTDIDEFTAPLQTAHSLTTTAKLQRIELEHTEEGEIIVTHGSIIDSQFSIKPTTQLDLYSPTTEPHLDTLDAVVLNVKSANIKMYIGIVIGVVVLIATAVIIGAVLCRRRDHLKESTENVTQNPNDAPATTDTNINSELSSVSETAENRALNIPPRKGMSNTTNTIEIVPNMSPLNHIDSTGPVVPRPDDYAKLVFQSRDQLGANGSPMYVEISKYATLQPTDNIYHVDSQVN